MKKDNLTSSFLALRDKLHRSALAFLKNDEDARDALQDTFFNLLKGGGVDTETEARNKLFTVLKNLCIDRLRRPKILPLDDIDIANLEVKATYFEDMDKYESLLTSGLTDLQRRIYYFVVHDDLEYTAIAEKMGMSIESVKKNMSRARKKIRDNYKQIDR